MTGNRRNVWTSLASEGEARGPYRLIALLGCGIALLCAPPVFESLFASIPSPSSDRNLWVLVCVLVGVSCYVAVARNPRTRGAIALFLALLGMCALELGTRFVVRRFLPEQERISIRIGRTAFPELAAYQGHAFTQFAGNPSARVVEDQVLGSLSDFNNFGFRDRDFSKEKPAGVVRIVALGGSTTQSGYPAELVSYLHAHEAGGLRYEALNFGLGWYNTAHSLANFVFTARDFDPDFVIIHHATNEKDVRNYSRGFRSDYSHALKPWDPPAPLDGLAIRVSVVYRLLRYHLVGLPGEISLARATLRAEGDVRSDRYSRREELEPFRRNIETIIDLALLDGAVPILTTQPHRFEPLNPWEDWIPHMQQANEVIREIAEARAAQIIFVDLDRLMTRAMDHVFIDLVHVDEDGRRVKAHAIGERIISYGQSR